MEYIGIPAIVVICYLTAEIYKALIRKEESNRFIPIIAGITGGLIGLLAYYLYPNMILDAQNPIIAISIGIVSGLASTGSNQLIKQILKNKKEE